jgi:hypothetical protein
LEIKIYFLNNFDEKMTMSYCDAKKYCSPHDKLHLSCLQVFKQNNWYVFQEVGRFLIVKIPFQKISDPDLFTVFIHEYGYVFVTSENKNQADDGGRNRIRVELFFESLEMNLKCLSTKSEFEIQR